MRTAVAIAALLAAAAPAPAQQPEIAPFRPALTLDTDPALCGPFLSAWTRVFDGTRDLDESWLDLEAAFPGAEVISFPRERLANGRYGGLWNSAFAEPVDLDGDGEDGVLHLESHDVGWRYLGVELYLFDTVDDYERIRAANRQTQSGERLHLHRHDGAEPAAPLILTYGQASVVHLIEFDGAVYTRSILPKLRQPQPGRPANVILYRLRAKGEPAPVCELNVLPAVEVFDDFIRESALFATLRSMYGQPGNCLGTMGWTAPDPRSPLVELFFRPQAMEGSTRLARPWPGDDAARELRLLSWGLSDPVSWQVYLDLKAARAPFLRQMAGHCRDHFTGSDDDARRLAEHGYRFLIDSIVYSRNPDRSHLTGITARAKAVLPITLDSTPAQVTDAALSEWLNLNADPGYTPDPYFEERLWHDAVLAAIYTRRDPALVRRMAEGFAAHIAGQEDNLARNFRGGRYRRIDETLPDDALIAALGDADLMQLALDLGADVDARTNWFSKTPLMYAAQRDDLEAARVLLALGADPSAATEQRNSQCEGSLQRDHRTALMYAAENASLAMIGLLLGAGADAGAIDTRGHSALWYLDRNARLTGAEKARAREWLEGAG